MNAANQEAMLAVGTAFLFSLAFTHFLLPIAHKTGLLDSPSSRKKHKGRIPLVGGLALFLGVATTLPLFYSLDQSILSFLAAGAILVAVGVIDDRRGLNVKLRIFIEMIAASIMVFGGGLWVGNLGNLLGIGEIHMPFWLAYPFTLIAVFGILNAINMIDGMDGVAGGICLTTITLLLVLTDSSKDLETLGPLLCGGLAAYLLCNLRLLPYAPKIFLGDAGSKLLGLALVWFVIDVASSNSNERGGIDPANALFYMGLPLFDMVTTTIRRLKKGVSPFSPDRTHVHHILQRAGFEKHISLMIILMIALAINLVGVVLNLMSVPEVVQFLIFLTLFALYSYNVQHAFKLSIRIRKKFIAKKREAAAY